jgi:hypothetical protein
MDLWIRLGVVAVLLAAGVVITRRYRRHSSDDAARGAVDAAGERLWPALPPELTNDASDAQGRPMPTWVIFTTPLCVSCNAVQHDLERSFPHHRVRKVDATEHPELADLYGVRRAPTTVLADTSGQIIERLVGPEAVRDFIGTVDDAVLQR